MQAETCECGPSDPVCRVFVVEDNALLRGKLELLIGMEDGMVCAGGAGDAEAALEAVPGQGPDVVLIDLSLPGMGGIELLEKLRKTAPGSRCLVVSGSGERVHADQARAAGARGYMVKGAPEEILEAVRCVHAGGTCFP